MDRIPYIPFSRIHPKLKQEMLESFEQFYENQQYILGSNLNKFENEFANYIGVQHAIGTGNGHDALLIILKALGIGKGDEVIIPAHTFIATCLSIVNAQATPILVDVDPNTFNIDVSLIESRISKKTKAIVPVHLYGNPCAVHKIRKIAVKHKLHLIEDNAQAQGATVDQNKTGSIGIMNFTSFYPTKNIGGLGDGGMITTNNKDLEIKAKSLRNYGKSKEGLYSEVGINSRLDDLQATLLSVKMKYLDNWNSERIDIAGMYQSQLFTIDEIKFQSNEPTSKNVRHIFPILTNRRDELKRYLAEKGIETLVHYDKPIHLHTAFSTLIPNRESFGNAESICDKELSLPIYPGLKHTEVKFICRQVVDFFTRS